VKSNFFSADTMRELAQRYVKPRWQRKAGIEPSVFPDKEEIRELRDRLTELEKKLDDREDDLKEAKREEIEEAISLAVAQRKIYKLIHEKHKAIKPGDKESDLFYGGYMRGLQVIITRFKQAQKVAISKEEVGD